MSTKTKNAFFLKDCNDAGTEQNFEAGSIHPISEGSFVNYKAAGLVREATPSEASKAKLDAPVA